MCWGTMLRMGGDSSFRKIRVRMKDPELQGKFKVRHRSGYYADAR